MEYLSQPIVCSAMEIWVLFQFKVMGSRSKYNDVGHFEIIPNNEANPSYPNAVVVVKHKWYHIRTQYTEGQDILETSQKESAPILSLLVRLRGWRGLRSVRSSLWNLRLLRLLSRLGFRRLYPYNLEDFNAPTIVPSGKPNTATATVVVDILERRHQVRDTSQAAAEAENGSPSTMEEISMRIPPTQYPVVTHCVVMPVTGSTRVISRRPQAGQSTGQGAD
jgi:hypothetical protein